MTVLSDPAASEAVLVGVHSYTHLENLPAVAHNLLGLQEALTDPTVWGLPKEACTILSQPLSAGQIVDTVREKARRARDTLLVYYAGHGLTDPHTDELYLALADSDREREYTALRYEYVRRAVLDPQARARRTVVILDCCYSGRALLGRMSASAHIADQAVAEGTCLLTASAETRPALSPPGERYTAFTGALIKVLSEGIAGEPDPLDMDTVYRHVHRQLLSKSRPLPQQRNRNTGGLIAIARNRAVTASPATVPAASPLAPPSPDHRRGETAAEMEERAERLRLETEKLRGEAESRGREILATARRLAEAVAAPDDPDFKPYWFAVPENRTLLGEYGSLDPVAELTPGAWYLAVGRRGQALVAQAEDGRRGLLLDTDGLERGQVSDDAERRPQQPTGVWRQLRHALTVFLENAKATDGPADDGAAPADPDFVPFWFSVPETRTLLGEDGSLDPVAELPPGTWHLAVGQRGQALVAKTQDGRRGLLLNTDGIHRELSEAARHRSREGVTTAPHLADAVTAPASPNFVPFWFAVPEIRTLLGEDGSLDPVAELTPGTWYLAVGRRGQALIAQTQDGHRGLLLNAEGIQMF